jgi:hypothetical protein
MRILQAVAPRTWLKPTRKESPCQHISAMKNQERYLQYF